MRRPAKTEGPGRGGPARIARRLARECVHVVAACLRDEERGLAYEEFLAVISAGIEELEGENIHDRA